MWLTEPELFLYSKSGGNDVQVWRCKKPMISSSSAPPLVVPMIPGDFEYVSQVKNHSDLVDEDTLDWEETDYKALVKYISERRLLVNSQGLVIVELWKSSDGNQMDANALPIYLRSHDILSLKAYIPEFRERPIPLRKVQYLEDINGKAAPVVDGEGDSTNTTKQVVQLQDDLKRERSEKLALAKRVADAKAENKKLEAENMNLHGTNTKLKQDVVDAEAKNKTLEAENMNQNDTNMKLKQDLADAEAKNKTLEAENVNLKSTNTKLEQDLATTENEVTDLKSKDKTSVEKVTKLTEDVIEWKRKLTELKTKTKSTSDDQEKRIKKLTAEVVEWKDKARRLESTNKTQEETIRRLNADLVRAKRESWMNEMPDDSSWVGVEQLTRLTNFSRVTILGGQGVYRDIGEFVYTNVRTAYMYQVRLNDNVKPFRGIAISDLCPNREKARFSRAICWTVNANGILYVVARE